MNRWLLLALAIVAAYLGYRFWKKRKAQKSLGTLTLVGDATVSPRTDPPNGGN
jgi:membrane protein implicated in regulation of membrane protease activity